jgi:toxin-antitoxin system PIN domain toxin
VRAWWERVLGEDDAVGLPWIVLVGVLRLATQPRIFPRPLAPADAIGRIDAWLARDNIRIAREKEDHWKVLRELLAATGTAANLANDAHLAALAISGDATLASVDADFGRFKGLRWENPLG